MTAQDEVPSCQHWIFGNITIEEQGGPVRYERAIFFTFKTLDEFRAALRFVEPLFQPSTGEKHE